MKPAVKKAIGIGLGLAVVGGATWFFMRNKTLPAITSGGGGASGAALALQFDAYFISAVGSPNAMYFVSGGQKHYASEAVRQAYAKEGYTGYYEVDKATFDAIPTGSVLS